MQWNEIMEKVCYYCVFFSFSARPSTWPDFKFYFSKSLQVRFSSIALLMLTLRTRKHRKEMRREDDKNNKRKIKKFIVKHNRKKEKKTYFNMKKCVHFQHNSTINHITHRCLVLFYIRTWFSFFLFCYVPASFHLMFILAYICLPLIFLTLSYLNLW